LVFVFDGADGETSGPRQIDNSRFFARLAQRVVHILGTNVASGQLYEVDMRLRPNGQSGLPCVTYEGFLRYQEDSAWTWEHQALVRARPVAGDQALCDALIKARLVILRRQRDSGRLLEDVVSMRRRMLHEGESRIGGTADQFDLKRDPGGIVDIEFIVQYLVLKAASKYPELAKDTDVVNLLASLVGHGILSEDHGEKLRLGYLAYRAHVHRAVLTGAEPLGHIDKFKETLLTVIAIRDEILPDLPALSGLAGSRLVEN
jgi:glutamate-ammonia-ligase adenylyltransferase